jgi:hypothetical protein
VGVWGYADQQVDVTIVGSRRQFVTFRNKVNNVVSRLVAYTLIVSSTRNNEVVEQPGEISVPSKGAVFLQ